MLIPAASGAGWLLTAAWLSAAQGGARSEAPAEALSAGLACAASAIEAAERLYGRVDALTLLVYPDSADLDVRNPEEPLHVDRFSCEAGLVGPPEPVQAGRNERRLEARLFPLTQEDLAIVPELLSGALHAVETEDPSVSHLSLERPEVSDDFGDSFGRPVFRVYAEGPRGGGYVEFRLDGRRGRVVRW